MGKKLYKSSLDRKICGVCGGFAEFFGIDATILRLLVVLFTLAGGPVYYFILLQRLLCQMSQSIINDKVGLVI